MKCLKEKMTVGRACGRLLQREAEEAVRNGRNSYNGRTSDNRNDISDNNETRNNNGGQQVLNVESDRRDRRPSVRGAGFQSLQQRRSMSYNGGTRGACRNCGEQVLKTLERSF
jgi:hypothetical protein